MKTDIEQTVKPTKMFDKERGPMRRRRGRGPDRAQQEEKDAASTGSGLEDGMQKSTGRAKSEPR